MRNTGRITSLLLWAVLAADGCFAQTADEIIQRHLRALGGREALSRLSSRTIIGTVSVTTPGGEVSGPIEIYSKPPNKTRTLMKLDLSAFGSGELTFDQRFDGTSAYVIDTVNGNRELTGNQLENMRNATFPTAFLNYRNAGIAATLADREKIAGQETYVLILTPGTGPVSRHYLDASTHLLLKTVVTIDIPQMGLIEQASEFSDYRTVDEVKVPFGLKITNPVQTLTVKVSSVEHNRPLDDSMFARPSPQ